MKSSVYVFYYKLQTTLVEIEVSIEEHDFVDLSAICAAEITNEFACYDKPLSDPLSAAFPTVAEETLLFVLKPASRSFLNPTLFEYLSLE